MGWKQVNDKLSAMAADFAYTGSQRPPKPAEIDAVEKRLGVRFPKDYRDMVTRYAAFTVEAKPEHWPAPKEYDVGPAWTFETGFALLAFGADVPEFLDIERATAKLRQTTGSDLVPFFQRFSNADRTCFTPYGSIVEWRHDESGFSGSEHDTVYDLLLANLETLEANMAQMKRLRAQASAKKPAPQRQRKAPAKKQAAPAKKQVASAKKQAAPAKKQAPGRASRRRSQGET